MGCKQADCRSQAPNRAPGRTCPLLALYPREQRDRGLFQSVVKQIPRSYAANAFNALREAMQQIEIVRLIALWDQPHVDHQTILSVVELVDDDKVISALADTARAMYGSGPEPTDPNLSAEERETAVRMVKEYNAKRGAEHATKAAVELREAIAEARAVKSSPQLKSVRNLRNKHVAHYLTQSNAEQNGEIIAPMKVGDEKPVLEASLRIIQLLYCWVNGVGLSFEQSQKIDKKCAEELWNGCKFDIVDRTN